MAAIDPVKALTKELDRWDERGPADTTATAVDDDVFHWEVTINGTGSYAGGLFRIDVRFPPNYPFAGPDMKFVTQIFHCNVRPDGAICMAKLQQWNQSNNMADIILDLLRVLDSPQPDLGGNEEAVQVRMHLSTGSSTRSHDSVFV